MEAHAGQQLWSSQVAFDVYLTLLAIGWIDGALSEPERVLILRAAERDGMSSAHLERLADAAGWPVSFEDLVPALDRQQQRYVYALASYVARLDGPVEPTEEAALDAFAQVLGVCGRERAQLDEIALTRVISGHDVARFEPDGLRAEIADCLDRAHTPVPPPVQVHGEAAVL